MIQQWQCESTTSLIFNLIKSTRYLFKSRMQNIYEIELYFSRYFGREVKLMPSGRSAIHNFALSMGMSRDQTAFVTKYSSYCMYQSLGSLMNVSTDFVKPELVVVNHKWGTRNTETRKIKESTVIEDSCDSLLIQGAELFSNDGQVEIVSLSKVIGTLSGALVLFKESNLKEKYRVVVHYKEFFLGHVQFIRKLIRIFFPDNFRFALQYEYANIYLTKLEVMLIRSAMSSYSTNFDLHKQRYFRLRAIYDLEEIQIDRIGPGVVFKIVKPYEDLHLVNPPGIIQRKFDFSKSNDSFSNYKDCLYVPIHANVSLSTFDSYLEFISKHKQLFVIN
jgi:putative PLP-dependent aminotransferase (TIGR04422 family)